MADVQNERTYDSYIKEFMGICSEQNVVKFINGLYGESLPLDSEVTRLETETHNQGEERRSDFMLKINHRVFHIEVESSDDDGDMILRMFEYGFRGALMHGRTKDSLTLRFPDPIVLFLRSNEKTPAEFTVNLEFSNNGKYNYSIPVKKLADYTPDTLVENKLYALSLFYPMKYEELLRKKHTDDDESNFLNEIISIIDMINAEKEKSEISSAEADLILEGLEDILQRVLSKSEILNREGVDGLMENIRKKYAFERLNWKEEGREEGRRDAAREMKRDNLPLDTIQRYTRLSAEEIQALQP